MLKTIVAVCTVILLVGCVPSLQEVDAAKQRCNALGGVPYTVEWKGTVQTVKCKKDGHSYSNF